MRVGENRFSWEHNFWVSARAWLGVQDVDGKFHRLQSCRMLQWCQASILESKRGLEVINEETPPCILRIINIHIYIYIYLLCYVLYLFIMFYIYLDDRYHVCSILFPSEPTIHRIPICHIGSYGFTGLHLFLQPQSAALAQRFFWEAALDSFLRLHPHGSSKPLASVYVPGVEHNNLIYGFLEGCFFRIWRDFVVDGTRKHLCPM